MMKEKGKTNQKHNAGKFVWRLDKNSPMGIAERENGSFFVKGGFDLPFFLLTMLLLAIGLIMLFSSSYAYAFYRKNDSFHFIKRQIVFAVLGVIGMIIVSKINYHKLRGALYVLLPLTLGLLVLVLILPPTEKGFHRWIDLGFTTFQPSEIGKFVLTLLLAHLISLNQHNIGTFKYGIIPYMGIILVFCGLIMAEKHLSATILTFLLGIVLIFVGGAPHRWFAVGGIIAAVVIAALIIFPQQILDLVKSMSNDGEEYQLERIVAWLDKEYQPKDARWQTNQSLFAIGSGGLLGAGIGKSRQKYLYVSEPQNDFIFSIVCEELGFVGAALILLLFVLLVWRGFVIAMRAPDRFGSLLTLGLVFQVGLQTALNVAVVTDTIPNTGISLPFFSSGGTALMMLLLQIGIVLGVSRASNIKN